MIRPAWTGQHDTGMAFNNMHRSLCIFHWQDDRPSNAIPFHCMRSASQQSRDIFYWDALAGPSFLGMRTWHTDYHPEDHRYLAINIFWLSRQRKKMDLLLVDGFYMHRNHLHCGAPSSSMFHPLSIFYILLPSITIVPFFVLLTIFLSLLSV